MKLGVPKIFPTMLFSAILVVSGITMPQMTAQQAFAPSVVSASTGGGQLAAISGGKITFGFDVALSNDGTVKGHIEYHDHDIGLKMSSDSITFFAPGCTATFEGAGDSNFGPVNFLVTVTDNGEPGSSDTFSIAIITDELVVYAESGTLSSGNIEIHGLGCP